MALFHFDLEDGEGGIRDPEGTEFADLEMAKDYGTVIARELMRNCERDKRHWKLVVRDSEGDQVSAVLFAAVDPTLDHLDPSLRQLFEGISESLGRLRETVFLTDSLSQYTRAIHARSSGRPHLAARFGQRVDVPPPGLLELFKAR